MKTLSALTAILALNLCLPASASASAGGESDPELSKLEIAYEAALERTVQPLSESYERELQRVVDTRTRESDLDGALAAKREMEKIGREAEKNAKTEESGNQKEAISAKEADDDAELQSLRATYELEVDRAVSPLQATYERELRKIIRERTRKSDLEGAIAARTKLEEIAGDPDEEEDDSPPGSTRRPPDEWFVGRTWISPAGTAFIFQEDGTCIREGSGGRTEGSWRRRGSLVISEVEDKSRATRYFRFASETEGWYGDDKDEIKSELTLR